jgi:hypothetical protein
MLCDAEPALSLPSNSSRAPLVLVLSPSGIIAANCGDEPVGGVCLDLWISSWRRRTSLLVNSLPHTEQ